MCIRDRTYAYPQDDFLAQLVAGDVQEQMPLYHQLFGPYPFAQEQYGHAQFGWGGGMEPVSYTHLDVYKRQEGACAQTSRHCGHLRHDQSEVQYR